MNPEKDLAKPEKINSLVSKSEKREIQAVAKMFGLTTPDYFLRLHRLTVSMMQPRSRRRVN